MNDRYLFKAKRIDNGEWVRGGSLITFMDDGVKSYYMPQFNEKCVCEHDEITDDILSFSDCRFYKVDESTLCQCTGSKDKNGTLIWENDIIKTEVGKAIVNWNHCAWRIKWLQDTVWRRDLWYWVKSDDWSVEVIGNIFDNQELLEVE